MNIVPMFKYTLLIRDTRQRDAYKHIPRTSTVAMFWTTILIVDLLDVRYVQEQSACKRLLCNDPHSHLNARFSGFSIIEVAFHSSAQAVNSTVSDNGRVRCILKGL